MTRFKEATDDALTRFAAAKERWLAECPTTPTHPVQREFECAALLLAACLANERAHADDR